MCTNLIGDIDVDDLSKERSHYKNQLMELHDSIVDLKIDLISKSSALHLDESKFFHEVDDALATISTAITKISREEDRHIIREIHSVACSSTRDRVIELKHRIKVCEILEAEQNGRDD